MTYAETDMKFRVRSIWEELSLDDCNFEIVIRNRWGTEAARIEKEDCFQDSEGDWYFTFENPEQGVYKAYFKAAIDDEDFTKTYRVFTDVQEIAHIGVCGCCTEEVECDCGCMEHKVEYEQVWIANISGECYLVGSDGAFILTNDGRRIKFKS